MPGSLEVFKGWQFTNDDIKNLFELFCNDSNKAALEYPAVSLPLPHSRSNSRQRNTNSWLAVQKKQESYNDGTFSNHYMMAHSTGVISFAYHSDIKLLIVGVMHKGKRAHRNRQLEPTHASQGRCFTIQKYKPGELILLTSLLEKAKSREIFDFLMYVQPELTLTDVNTACRDMHMPDPYMRSQSKVLYQIFESLYPILELRYVTGETGASFTVFDNDNGECYCSWYVDYATGKITGIPDYLQADLQMRPVYQSTLANAKIFSKIFYNDSSSDLDDSPQVSSKLVAHTPGNPATPMLGTQPGDNPEGTRVLGMSC